MTDAPHDNRPADSKPVAKRGWLKNGNPPGDLRSARRCGAKNRRGNPCQCPAMANGRCRLHGGLSTGAKTPEGKARAAMSNYRHGNYTNQAIAERREARMRARDARRETANLLRLLRELFGIR
jgi:hypothetical protein